MKKISLFFFVASLFLSLSAQYRPERTVNVVRHIPIATTPDNVIIIQGKDESIHINAIPVTREHWLKKQLLDLWHWQKNRNAFTIKISAKIELPSGSRPFLYQEINGVLLISTLNEHIISYNIDVPTTCKVIVNSNGYIHFTSPYANVSAKGTSVTFPHAKEVLFKDSKEKIQYRYGVINTLSPTPEYDVPTILLTSNKKYIEVEVPKKN